MTKNPSNLIISPSLLAADQLNLEAEIAAVTSAGADWLHIDVMDGHYVPNITYGPGLVAAVKRVSTKPLDVHLMISPALPFVNAFAKAGADILTIHPEADAHPHRILSMIRDHGMKAGVALNPGTSLSTLDSLWPVIDLILVMSVNPGFSGQKFISESLVKVAAVRQEIDKHNPNIVLEVDGGISERNSKALQQAGANALVVGSGIFNYSTPDYVKIIQTLKGN